MRSLSLAGSAVVAWLAAATPVPAEEPFVHWGFGPDRPWCMDDCYVHFYGGRLITSSMKQAFGIDGFRPIWNWEWGDSGLIAGAASKRLVRFGNALDIEAEIGVGKRFGDLRETEGWAAFYVRWTLFPWNDYLRTTVAVSTGLDYASGTPAYEVRRGGAGEGSRLLHFLSPEISFALPSAPDWELVFRYHHRSGGREFLLGETALFNSVSGGVQYGTAGIRVRF